MDEEVKDCDDISKTAEVELKQDPRTKSTGGRMSTDSLSFSYSKEKILPQYLRPSTASCHDFCKYGKKDTSKVAAKRHLLSRSMSSKIIRDEEQNKLDSSNPGERMKKLPFLYRSLSSKASGSFNLGERRKELAKPKASLQSKLDFSDESAVNEKTLSPVKKSSEIENRVPSPFRESIVSAKQAVLICPEHKVNQVESLNLGDTKKGQVIKLNTILHSKISPAKSKIMKRHTISPADAPDVAGEPDIIKEDIASHAKASSPVKKAISSLRFQTLKQEASSPLKGSDSPSKTVITLKRRKTTAIKPMFLVNPSRRITGQEAGEAKVMNPPSASVSPKTPLDGFLTINSRKYSKEKHFSSTKNQEKSKKSAHGSSDTIENIVCATPLDLLQTEEKVIKPISEILARENKVITPKGEEKRRLGRNASVHPVNNLPKPHKLRVGRGKEVDLHPDIDSPRRLRFKKARLVGGKPNGNGKAGIISIKKAESVVSRSIDSGLEGQAVLLRHQDMQMKKDSQGLLNQVIEETATMLEETRKSKVKALVGAFETVISLQEINPASTV